jgi:ion channel-forming bestrophin family protein
MATDVDPSKLEVNRFMAALLAAIRRLFPPLKVGRNLWICMVALGIYGLLVSMTVKYEHLPDIEWGAEATVLNGLVLSFLIGFRNNHAYERWWEARQLWGQLINENRNLCLKLMVLPGIEAREREGVGRLIVAFGEALKDHLRRRDGTDEPRREDSPRADERHLPSRLAGAIYEAVVRWQREGRFDGWTLLWLDGHVKSLMDVCGACEKIRNTPLSSSYRALLRHGIALYLAVSPFALIEDTGLAGYPVFMLAAYFLLGIEMVAEDIEEPFGSGSDNLPLELYCATIKRSVREILGIPEHTANVVPSAPALGTGARQDPQ